MQLNVESEAECLVPRTPQSRFINRHVLFRLKMAKPLSRIAVLHKSSKNLAWNKYRESLEDIVSQVAQ